MSVIAKFLLHFWWANLQFSCDLWIENIRFLKIHSKINRTLAEIYDNTVYPFCCEFVTNINWIGVDFWSKNLFGSPFVVANHNEVRPEAK